MEYIGPYKQSPGQTGNGTEFSLLRTNEFVTT